MYLSGGVALRLSENTRIATATLHITHVPTHTQTHTRTHTHTTDGFRQGKKSGRAKRGWAGCCKLSKPWPACCRHVFTSTSPGLHWPRQVTVGSRPPAVISAFQLQFFYAFQTGTPRFAKRRSEPLLTCAKEVQTHTHTHTQTHTHTLERTPTAIKRRQCRRWRLTIGSRQQSGGVDHRPDAFH